MSPDSGPLVSIDSSRFAVLASKRSTIPLRVATQTSSSPIAIPSGLLATLTLLSALPVVASKRTTWS